jgi:hypothetical protein
MRPSDPLGWGKRGPYSLHDSRTFRKGWPAKPASLRVDSNSLVLYGPLHSRAAVGSSIRRTDQAGQRFTQVDAVLPAESPSRAARWRYVLRHMTQITPVNAYTVAPSTQVYFYARPEDGYVVLGAAGRGSQGDADFVPTRAWALANISAVEVFMVTRQSSGGVMACFPDGAEPQSRHEEYQFATVTHPLLWEDWTTVRLESGNVATVGDDDVVFFRRPGSPFPDFTPLIGHARVFVSGSFMEWPLMSADLRAAYSYLFTGYVPSRAEALANCSDAGWLAAGYEFYTMEAVAFRAARRGQVVSLEVFVPTPGWELIARREIY